MLLDDIFSAPGIDRTNKRLKDEVIVVLLAILMPLIFIFLFYSVDKIQLYCFIVLGLNIADLTGNVIVRENLQKLIRDAELVRTRDRDRNYMYAKRRIAEWYWIELPQLKRLALHLIANGAALFFATNQGANLGIFLDPNLSYLILCVGIAGNELMMLFWRRRRDQKLQRIAGMEENAIRVSEN